MIQFNAGVNGQTNSNIKTKLQWSKCGLRCVNNVIHDVPCRMVTPARAKHKADSRGCCRCKMQLKMLTWEWWTGNEVRGKRRRKEKKKKLKQVEAGEAEWDDLTIRFIRGIIFSSTQREGKREKEGGGRKREETKGNDGYKWLLEVKDTKEVGTQDRGKKNEQKASVTKKT